MSGKRVSLASLAVTKVEAVPGAGRPDLLHVHPDTVAPTPLNPRRAFDETELAELGEDMRSGQLQPCVAVARAAYLKLYPEHADQLPDGCRYVMAAGERRWRAAALAGLDTLDILLRHDLTESRVRFFAAVLSENVQRANFNPIEEADGLRAMLDLHDGNQSAAAAAMGKSKGWFNQRIGLLRLTDEMVQLVFEGKLTAFRDMRRYAALPPEEQYPAWKRDQEAPRPAPAPVSAVPAVASAPVGQGPAGTYTAVHTPSPSPSSSSPAASSAGPAPSFTAVKREAEEPTAPAPDPVPGAPRGPVGGPAPTSAAAAEPDQVDSVPEPRTGPEADPGVGERKPPKPFPYHDGVFAGQLLIHRMDLEQLVSAHEVITAHLNKANQTTS